MYSASSKDEVVIKLIGKLSLEFPELDQLKVRSIAEEVLYKYDVVPQETALVASDIEEKIQLYLAVRRLDGYSKKTLYYYELNLGIFASYLRKPLAAIDAMDIRMYLAQRCKNLKATSTNGQIFILKAFFSWLQNEEYITKNPMVKIKQTKQPKRLRSAMSEEEVELLREACETKREKALIEFLVSSGIRLAELISLNRSDLDWNERSFRIIGKGDKERKAYFSIRAKVLIKEYLEERTDENSALFVTEPGPHRRLGERAVQKAIKKIAKRVETSKSIYPHLFRHTMAQLSLNKGMSITTLQKLLGHESPSTTQVYCITSDENALYEYKKTS